MLVSANTEPYLVESITHTGKQERGIVRRYATVNWIGKCDAVRRLDVDVRGAEVVSLAAGDRNNRRNKNSEKSNDVE